jgi:hypothetical protein
MALAWPLHGHPTIEGVTATGATGTGKLVFSIAPAFTTNITLGVVSSATGQLKLANAGSANLTTIQAGAAAAARTYTWPTDFGAAGTVLTDAAGNGTLSWAAGSGGAGLGANTFTDTQTITQATANHGIIASTGYSLTGSSAVSMIDLAGTWNTSGVATAIKLNMTNTASGAGSLLMDLQVASASKFAVDTAGQIVINGLNGNGGANYGFNYAITNGLGLIGGSTRATNFPSYLALLIRNEDAIYVQTSLPLRWGDTQNVTTVSQISTNLGSIILNTAAISTSATDGFLYIPTCAGTPSGTPTAFTGRIPMVYDTSAHQFWFYDGGWKQPKTPAGAAIVTWQ